MSLSAQVICSVCGANNSGACVCKKLQTVFIAVSDEDGWKTCLCFECIQRRKRMEKTIEEALLQKEIDQAKDRLNDLVSKQAKRNLQCSK